MKIDVFCHVIPPKYLDLVSKMFPERAHHLGRVPTLYDLNHRFRIMDEYEDVKQVITLSQFAGDVAAGSNKVVDLIKQANDETAELVTKYPDRFIASVASLPLENIDASLQEIDRAINDLKCKGVQLFTPFLNRPLDSEEFIPIYDKMVQHDLPIWIHPGRPPSYADYKTESESLYRIHHIFGWPYETTAAMTRLVLSGIFEKYPDLKIITHHCGGMVPFFADRIVSTYNYCEAITKEQYLKNINKPPIEYFKKFYADTALNGGTSALMCGLAFFGIEKILFATDMPFDDKLGKTSVNDTIEAIEAMDISRSEKGMIFEENAVRLLRFNIQQ